MSKTYTQPLLWRRCEVKRNETSEEIFDFTGGLPESSEFSAKALNERR